MANVPISGLPPITLPLDGATTFFETSSLEAGEEVSRKVSVDNLFVGFGLDATFVTVTPNVALPNERILTGGSNISVVDGGAGSTITIDLDDPILLSAGLVGAPSYSYLLDPNTGHFNVAPDVLGAAAGGFLIAQADGSNGAGNLQFIITPGGPQNNAVFPALAFGAGGSGFFESIANQLAVGIAGTQRWFWSGDIYGGLVGGSAAILNEVASLTNPTLIPNRTLLGTGVGASGSLVALISDSVDAVHYGEFFGGILQNNQTDVGLTASITQTQAGALQLNSSYNEVATVANTGDAVKAASVSAGLRLVVVNNGANALQLFPAVFDDFGAGVDASITIAVGAVGVFIGRDAVNWDTLFNGAPSGGVSDPLLLGDGSAGAPTYSFSASPTTGFFSAAANEISFATNGLERWRITNGAFLSLVGNGPQLQFEAATATNPTLVPHAGAPSTGIGAEAATPSNLSLIAGGVEVIRCVNTPGVDQAIISPGVIVNDPATPSLAFGDGDTGFFESVDDTLAVVVAGTNTYQFAGDQFQGLAAASPQFRNVAATAIVANINPNKADPDTGLGSAALDQLSLIAGGLEGIRVTEAAAAITVTMFGDLTVTGGSIFITEQAAAAPDVAGDGQFWVRNDIPNIPMFSDDAGTDFKLGVVNDAVQARRTTTFTLTTAFVDVTLDATDVETDATIIEHDNVNTDDIDIKVTGTYEITYEADILTNATTNSTINADGRVRLNDLGTGINGSLGLSCAFRDTNITGNDFNSHLSVTFIANLTAGDFITLQLQKTEIGGSDVFVADEVHLQAKRIG